MNWIVTINLFQGKSCYLGVRMSIVLGKIDLTLADLLMMSVLEFELMISMTPHSLLENPKVKRKRAVIEIPSVAMSDLKDRFQSW